MSVQDEDGGGTGPVGKFGHGTDPDATTMATRGSAEAPGAVIGRYKLLQSIGEGGFGVVYMAEQTAPVKRRVALKIIKLGMDTRQVVARFEAERQALALMDHPNIAKVLDGGETETGRPYFVMELVRGIPVTDYCDQNRLEPAERLALFIDICRAVQHAHQKGIIHRDIKPSNVLVTLHDGTAVPKVIDFGIAKAMTTELTQRTLFTEFRQFVGTPEYMAPEQAEISGLDVDTRADVYSLGVLLYELLTGVTPFDARRLRRAAIDEIQRIIRDEEPERPSTRISSIGTGSAPDDAGSGSSTVDEIARCRHTDPHSLRRALRGDLDWIVMRCLEKDRTRRYDTANDLAADVRRHLADEPVVAGPPRVGYRMGKFVRRNRTLVATGVTIAAVLVVATAISAAATLRMRTAQGETRDRLEETKVARQEAEEMVGFLQSMMSSVLPAREGHDVRMVEFLDGMAGEVGDEFADRPVVEARLRNTLGISYLQLGRYDDAEAQLAAARDRRRDHLGADHPDTLTSSHWLGQVYQNQGRRDEAETLFRATHAQRRRVLGEDHNSTLWTLGMVAAAVMEQRRYEEAEALFRDVIAGRLRTLGPDHLDTLSARYGLALVLQRQRALSEAETEHREILEARQAVLEADHPDVMASVWSLGSVIALQGRFEEAEPLFRLTYETRRRTRGEDHPRTINALHNLALVNTDLGRLAEAERLRRDQVELTRRRYGAEHQMTFRAEHTLAALIERRGRDDEALRQFESLHERRLRVLGPDDRATLASATRIARLHFRHRRYDAAGPMFEELAEAHRRVYEADHPELQWALTNLANYLLTVQPETRRDPARALALSREACAMPDPRPDQLVIHAQALFATGDVDGAVDVQRRAIEGAADNEALRLRLEETLEGFLAPSGGGVPAGS